MLTTNLDKMFMIYIYNQERVIPPVTRGLAIKLKEVELHSEMSKECI